MKKLIGILIVFVIAVPLMAEEKIYVDGVDAFRGTPKFFLENYSMHPYTDASGNAISGTVIKREVNGNSNTIEDRMTVVNGYMEGQSVTYRNGVKLYEVEMSGGLKNGKYTSYYPSGAVRITDTYVDDGSNGIGTSYREDGTIFRQVWSKNDRLLAGFDYVDGNLVPTKDTVKNICIEGDQEAISQASSYYTLNRDAFFDNKTNTYIDSKKKAITGHITDISTETVIEMDTVNGLLEGVVKTFTNGRLIRETHYESGRKHGDDITYYKNGLSDLSVQYSHGNIDGLTTHWQQDGKIAHEVIFRGGRAVYGYLKNRDKLIPMTKDDFKWMEESYL